MDRKWQQAATPGPVVVLIVLPASIRDCRVTPLHAVPVKRSRHFWLHEDL